MQGSAEFVTKDLRLIERFFYQLRSVIERKPKVPVIENKAQPQ